MLSSVEFFWRAAHSHFRLLSQMGTVSDACVNCPGSDIPLYNLLVDRQTPNIGHWSLLFDIAKCFALSPGFYPRYTTQHTNAAPHKARIDWFVCQSDGCIGSTAATNNINGSSSARRQQEQKKTITSSTSDIGRGSSGNSRLFLRPWHHVSSLPSSWFLSIFKPHPSPSGTKLGLGSGSGLGLRLWLDLDLGLNLGLGSGLIFRIIVTVIVRVRVRFQLGLSLGLGLWSGIGIWLGLRSILWTSSLRALCLWVMELSRRVTPSCSIHRLRLGLGWGLELGLRLGLGVKVRVRITPRAVRVKPNGHWYIYIPGVKRQVGDRVRVRVRFGEG